MLLLSNTCKHAIFFKDTLRMITDLRERARERDWDFHEALKYDQNGKKKRGGRGSKVDNPMDWLR